MERRKFMIGLGSAAAGSATLVGSSAFSFARAERDIEVNVVADENAYLGLEETSAYASGTADGELELDWGNNGRGTGLNDNADTRFDNVFKIVNQGTNDITRISFHDEEGATGYDSPAAEWYYSSDPTNNDWSRVDGEVNEDHPSLGTGEEMYIHVIFNLTDYTEDDLPDHLGIVAETS